MNPSSFGELAQRGEVDARQRQIQVDASWAAIEAVRAGDVVQFAPVHR